MTMSEQEQQADGTYPCFACHVRFVTATDRTMHVIRQRCEEIDDESAVDKFEQLHAMDEIARSVRGHDVADRMYEQAYGGST